MLSVLPAFFLLMVSSSSAWSSASILAPLEGSLPWDLAYYTFVSEMPLDFKACCFLACTYGKCGVLLGQCGLLVVFGLIVLLLLSRQTVGDGSLVLCRLVQYPSDKRNTTLEDESYWSRRCCES